MSDLLLIAATERELFAVDGVQHLCCGIGPVEAALRTTQRLTDRRYVTLLHVGIAGATAPGEAVGRLVPTLTSAIA